MKKLSIVGLAFVGVTILAMILVTVPVTGQVKQETTRPLTTKQLMAGLNGPNCSALGKGLKAGPADEEAWENLALNAALLNEASYILIADGRCPGADWADAATVLREESQKVLNDIDARNLEGARAAFAAMTKSCGACHSKYKK
jgi:hypothetical protein